MDTTAPSRLVACIFFLSAAGCLRDVLNGAQGSDGGAGNSPPIRCVGIGLDDVGCGCAKAGERQPCWPGNPKLRGRGDCRDGQQTCIATDEFLVWSQCAGYNIGTMCTGTCAPSEFQSCDTGEKDHLSGDDGGGVGGGPGDKDHLGEDDAGGVSGGGNQDGGANGNSAGKDGGTSSSSECVLGAFRWCDEPVFCNWGQQQCAPDGYWGKCVEVASKPKGCSGSLYDQVCCAMANDGCCQDFQHPYVDSKGHIVYPTLGTCK